jgi:hypothetical protein
MSVDAVGGGPWYARALGALTDTRTESAEQPAPEAPQAALSLDDVSPRAKSNLLALAGSLGTEPETLLAHLSSGQSIRSLLAGAADPGYGTSLAPAPAGGLAIDEYA